MLLNRHISTFLLLVLIEPGNDRVGGQGNNGNPILPNSFTGNWIKHPNMLIITRRIEEPIKWS